MLLIILTGYSFSMHLSNGKYSFPAKLLSSKPIKMNIEVFDREHTNPTWSLQNWTHFNSDPLLILKKLDKDAKIGCIECKRYLKEISKYENMKPNVINKQCLHVQLPVHIGFNWDTYSYYRLCYIRDINIGAITIAISTLKTKNEREKVGYNNFLIATFKSNDILPYFDGVHYAYLLKNVLKHYGFEEKHYSRIQHIGLTWSITHNINMRNQFLNTIRQLFHEGVGVPGDYFNKPEYSGAGVVNNNDCILM